MFLFADTETTGFFREDHKPGSPIQPHICQLAAQLCREDGRMVAEMNFLLRPKNWGVPKEAEAVHGISTAMCEQYGLSVVTAMKLFAQMVKQAKVLVCHRMVFDHGMLWSEFIRAEAAPELAQFLLLEKFCTMESNISLMNLPPTPKMVAAGRNNAKTPNLQEAHEFYLGAKFDDAHDAAADVNATRRVFFAMKARGLVPDFSKAPAPTLSAPEGGEQMTMAQPEPALPDSMEV